MMEDAQFENEKSYQIDPIKGKNFTQGFKTMVVANRQAIHEYLNSRGMRVEFEAVAS